MDPQEFVALVGEAHRALVALAAADAADLSASLAADAVPIVHEAATLADNVVALVTRRVETSGLWADAGARTAASWVAQVTGGTHLQAADRLHAARHVERYPDFAPAFRAGTTGVRHQLVMHRALWGPGRVKAVRRERFGEIAAAMADLAATADATELAHAMSLWAAAVDHAPEEAELAAWQGRYLVVTESLGECLLEGRLPLAEGRLLRRRLEAFVDSYHRNPAASPLSRRYDEREAHRSHPGDVSIGVDDRPSRAALMMDAFCHLAALGDAQPNAMPIVDGHVPQVLVVLPGAGQPQRLIPTFGRTGTAGPGRVRGRRGTLTASRERGPSCDWCAGGTSTTRPAR